MNLDKLEQQLYEIEQQLKGADSKNIENIQNKLQKKLKYLKRRKSKFKKEEAEYNKIKQDIAFIHRLQKTIARKKCPMYSLDNFSLYHLEGNKVMDTFDTIVHANLPKEEKIYFLQLKIYALEEQIEKVSKQLIFLQKRKKEELEIKDYPQVHKIEQMIKENKKNTYELKELMQKGKSAIISLKEVKANYKHQKRSKVKRIEIEEQKEYYQILLDLFDNEENYYFIKNLIAHNKKFLNARKENQSIILEILDRFILNSKKALMNQKLDHQNPDFYFGLFKEFLKHYPNLTSLERDCINERMKEFLCYVNKKRYKNRVELKNDLYSLMPNPTNTLEFHSYFDARYIDPFKNDVLRYNRVNLTKEYLEKLHKQIEEMQEEYYQKYQIVLKEEELANYFQCPIYDIQNSQYIASTFCLEGQKYAFSYGYDHEYNTYLRIHVFDTTFISEDSDLYREMQNHKKGKSKAVHYILSFKKGERTPAFTYQLKILKNGCVSSFKMYESTIKVDRVIKNKEWLRYREDATLKQFVGILNQLAIEYNLEEPFLNHQSMEQMIDAVLNIEIKRLIEKVDLPTLYQIHKDRNEEDMIKEYSKVCHYLKNLTKSEVEEFYNLFLHSKTYQFYATTPMYESHIFLDTSSFLGYLELQVLASYSKNVPVTEITKKYLSTFKELEQNLNEEDVYMSYKTQKYLEKVR